MTRKLFSTNRFSDTTSQYRWHDPLVRVQSFRRRCQNEKSKRYDRHRDVMSARPRSQ
ncbi:MAG: hypothetical protein JXA08_10345 [Methanomicrobiaceae archaeon]|nr:hypothetical protein [Methanomicrobiaceae archaeon]